ncbi:MAG: hypothetical protein AABX01_01520 [Candidatus Micrarchaeota archaeon]
MMELPNFAMRAYALVFSRHGATGRFTQRELEWAVSEPMRKKIFAILLRAGWLDKASRSEYTCVPPETAIRGLLDFRVPELLKHAPFPYALCGASAVEIWSDYSYIQRGIERSPYFVNILRTDLQKWKKYLNAGSVPNYIGKGSTIGEFVILLPVERLEFVEKNGLKVAPLKKAVKEMRGNYLYSYAFEYVKRKYGG